ncbi:unnamed protein product [marine sediment metagenome]|uniref:Uncharacterized protein n=1 Tax=marine sediment metagenome TaxID=412755 RepID=X1CZ13_9ZZZZ
MSKLAQDQCGNQLAGPGEIQEWLGSTDHAGFQLIVIGKQD